MKNYFVLLILSLVMTNAANAQSNQKLSKLIGETAYNERFTYRVSSNYNYRIISHIRWISGDKVEMSRQDVEETFTPSNVTKLPRLILLPEVTTEIDGKPIDIEQLKKERQRAEKSFRQTLKIWLKYPNRVGSETISGGVFGGVYISKDSQTQKSYAIAIPEVLRFCDLEHPRSEKWQNRDVIALRFAVRYLGQENALEVKNTVGEIWIDPTDKRIARIVAFPLEFENLPNLEKLIRSPEEASSYVFYEAQRNSNGVWFPHFTTSKGDLMVKDFQTNKIARKTVINEKIHQDFQLTPIEVFDGK